MRHKGLNDQKKSDFTQNPNSSDQRVKILVYEDLNLVGQYFFSHAVVMIGKGQDADLRLEDQCISDIQAIVHIQNDNIIISDRSKKLGVYLNNKPIKAAVLEPSDLVEIGKYSLKLQVISNCNKPAHSNNISLVPPKCSKNNSRAESFKQNSYLSDDSFELPPYKESKRSPFKHAVPSSPKSSKIPKDQNYPEDFFTLPPYRSSKSFDFKGAKSPVIKSSSKVPNSRFNLWFSGELKSGWTLLKVKKYLNRQFGIDYRKLTRFIRGRQIILKRDLTYLKAMKLYKAFESSGAICFVEPAKDPSTTTSGEKHNGKVDSVIGEKKSSHGKSEKMTSIFKGSSHLSSKSKNTLEKATKRQKNRSTAMLATIRKSGIFSGCENASSSMHRRLKARPS